MGTIMKPLSVLTYYWRNKRKVLPVILILAFSIVGVTSTAALADEIFRGQAALQNFYASYDLLSPTNEFTQQGSTQVRTDDLIKHEISALPEVDYSIKSVLNNLHFVRVLGQNDVPVFYINPSDRQQLFTQLGWKLTAGSLPKSGTNEIVLTQNILKNRGWKIGDTVGSAVDNTESLPGANKIVGVLQTTGDSTTLVTGGMGDLSYQVAQTSGLVQYTYLVHPKNHQLARLDSDLNMFQEQNNDSIYYNSLQNELTKFASDYNSAKVVLGLLNSVVVIVISISIALLYIIFLMQRANEFGLLAAIGYSKAFIVRKVLCESIGQIVLGWALGILFSQAIYATFNANYFTPHGLVGVNVLTRVPLIFSIPVPVVVIGVTALTILIQLGRLDPIAIIEKRD